MLQLFKISTGINQITTLSLSAIKNLISHIIRKSTTAGIKTFKIFSNIIILLSLLQLFNCNSSSLQIIDSRIVDGKYDNHPPLNNSSKKIKNIFESVAMVHCTAYYTQYEFEYSDQVLKNELDNQAVLRKGASFSINKNSAGTALILSITSDNILLLTCNHIIDYPSKIYDYYPREFRSDYINLYLEKKRQDQFATLERDLVTLEVIARDEDKDIAILSGKKIEEVTNISKPNFEIGKSKDIRTGNFVYVLGFPKGHKMVSSGILSVEGQRTDQFIIDAPFNRGMSGGLVFTIRDDSPNFELVGMAKSAAADFEYILTPREELRGEKTYNKTLPYEGNIYIEKKPRIRYGITFANSINMILDFIKENSDKIEAKGFNIDYLFEQKK